MKLGTALVIAGLGLTSAAQGDAPLTHVRITSPAQGSSIDTSAPVISGTAAVNGGPVSVLIYGGSRPRGAPLENLTASGTSPWSATSMPLSDGTYTAQAQQDQRGNTVTSGPVAFTVDTTPPTVAISSLSDTSGTPAFSGTAGNASGDLPTVTVNIYAGSSPGGTVVSTASGTVSGSSWMSGPASPALAPGAYTAQASRSDRAGNIGLSGPVTFTVPGPGAQPLPVATFLSFPAAPRTGDPITLVSISSPAPGSTIASLAWDLQGTGVFAPGVGATATTSFATAGSHVVRLRVTDTDGMSSVAQQTILVAPRSLPMMQPFPLVRIAGHVTSSGAVIHLLAVFAPVGARVSATCRSRGCPRHSETRVVAAGKKTAGGAATVILGRFEHLLRAGVVLDVKVTKSGEIGKFTRFVIRRNAAPRRTDRCLIPGVTNPVGCPSA